MRYGFYLPTRGPAATSEGLTAIVQRLSEEVVSKADAAPAPRGDRPVDFSGNDTKPGSFVTDRAGQRKASLRRAVFWPPE